MTFEFEVFEEQNGEKWVWIGNENDGGSAEYSLEEFENIGDIINFYISNYYPEILEMRTEKEKQIEREILDTIYSAAESTAPVTV